MAFEVETRGELVFGLASGIDRRHLTRLRRGEIEAELELDLHGLDARSARAALHSALREAYQQGVRCVLVIHGRGRGSESGPVLKAALPGWLETAPAGDLVMAFSSAQPDDGGAGASYVLLRRRRATGR